MFIFMPDFDGLIQKFEIDKCEWCNLVVFKFQAKWDLPASDFELYNQVCGAHYSLQNYLLSFNIRLLYDYNLLFAAWP